jgi:O-antigen/teichoic acid export membrane protein
MEITKPEVRETANLAGKLTYSFMLRGVDMLLGLGASVVAARIMGPEVLGIFSSALAISMLIGLMGHRGLGTAHLKIAASSEKEGACLSTLFLLKGFFIILCACALATHIMLTPLSEDRLYFKVLLVCAGVIIIQQLNNVIISAFNARIDTKKAETPRFIGNAVKNLLKVLVAFLGFGALSLSFSELAGAVMVLAIVVFLFRGLPLSRPSGRLMLRYLSLSVPLFFIHFSHGVANDLDKTMIKYFYDLTVGNMEVGLYTAGQRLGSVIKIFMIVVSVIFFPAFARLAAENNYERIKSIIQNFENIAICLLLPMFAALAAFSLPVILLLVGEEYRASSSIMQISIAGTFMMMLYQPYINFLNGAKGMIAFTAWLFLLYTMINVTLNAVLIPESMFGIDMLGLKGEGAAIGTSISYLVLGLISKLVSTRYIKVQTFSKYWREVIFLAFIYIIFIIGLNRFAIENIVAAMIGGAVFVILFWVFMYFFSKEHLCEAAINLSKISPRLAFISRRISD